ncbi:hypothetical protein [Bacteroides pyogenes]|uniref:hypothetical protein n=1 Tax=Bacteroides pyogenes TaxID=310300 RepID=UPI002FDA1070
MNTTVEVKVSIDIDDVYNELSWSDKETFLKSHIDDLGRIGDVAEQCFDDSDVKDFVEVNIDKLTDEVLMQEVKSRGLEL